MSPQTIRAWAWAHKWSSLVCTVFMFLLGLTGLPLIFHHEIGHLLGTEIEAPPLPAGAAARAVSLDEAVAVARQAHPGLRAQYLSPEEGSDDVWRVTLAAPPAPGADGKNALPAISKQAFTLAVIDARTGALLGSPPLTSGFMWIVTRLHIDLFAGLPGKLFLGGMGLLLLIALVSGAVLYAPFMRKLRFGQVRRRPRQPRLKWLDLHNLLGIVTLVWFFVVGATGVLHTCADLLVAHWQRSELGPLMAAASAQKAQSEPPADTPAASLQAAYEAAQAAAPGMRLYFMAFAGTPYASARHHAFFMRGATALTSRLPQPVLVDAHSAQVAAVPRRPWYLTALLLARPLHFGDYGGLPMQLLWAALDVLTLIVLGSGLYLWLRKGKA
ncbi:MAG: PepSY-associated TM helix domain-containing protein [Ottowia sp.]